MAHQRIRLKQDSLAAKRARLDMAVLAGHYIPEFIQKMCTRKVRYESEGDALAMLSVICGQRNGKPGRAYLCEHCGGWHITSRLKPEGTASA